MAQLAVPWFRDGGMAEQHLLRRERARVGLGDAGTHAEKRHLEPERVGSAIVEPAGDVPPFDAMVGVRTLVARESEFEPGHDRRVGDLRTGELNEQHQQQK